MSRLLELRYLSISLSGTQHYLQTHSFSPILLARRPGRLQFSNYGGAFSFSCPETSNLGWILLGVGAVLVFGVALF